MSSPRDSTMPQIERYTSYGIGGRGNLRRPSENKIVEITPTENGQKRRTSVWDSVGGVFRRKSTTEVIEEPK
ncbi:hypothetical protein JMJ35_002288 [Cladonia borealis]|uniref:Uncharacterized protein n=1 Tax=Cladonia borealis TaxID=184061 RepID=A0AA39R747_9LECA|nr:hypothetical protein JMJ35_002288 [Cladonia borealis]